MSITSLSTTIRHGYGSLGSITRAFRKGLRRKRHSTSQEHDESSLADSTPTSRFSFDSVDDSSDHRFVQNLKRFSRLSFD